jgi:hypothetical protein
MTMIEDELRAAFVARTRTLPAMDDPAGAAILRAKAIRRRRGIAGTAVMVLFVLAASGGVMRYYGGFGPKEPHTGIAVDSPRIAAANTMDVRVGQELWTADGRHFALSEVGTVTWVHRVPAGWLYGGDTGGVRLLGTDGSSTDPQIEGTDVAVSPDGTRVAWRMGDPKATEVTIYAATLSVKGVIGDRSSATAPQGVQPIGFAGARVLLRKLVEPKRYTFDFWTIGHTYTPTWIDKISTLYGEYKSLVIGRVPGTGEDCLALFDPESDGLHLVRKKCGLDLSDSVEGALSPTGRWLAVHTATKLRVLDLDRVFVDSPVPSVAPSVPVSSTRPPVNPLTCTAEGATGPPIWIDAKFVVATTDKGWAVCSTSGKKDAVDNPALAQLAWMPVPGNG